MHPGYSILSHPADIGIEAHGASLAEAFSTAAVALMSIILDLSAVQLRQSREIVIAAVDHGQLLVKWLSEVLYLFDGERFVGKEFRINELSTTRLRATVEGETFAPSRHSTKMDVKAVTYHQLSVKEDGEGGWVRVYLDI